MLNELEECLSLYLDPITYTPYLEAYRVLDSIGMEDQDIELTNIIGLGSDDSDSQQLIGRIEACLTYAVGGKLNEYGVIMSDGTPLIVMVKILEVVATFERYDNHQEVYDLFLTDEYDDTDRLAEIVSMFSDLEPIDVTHYLDTVRESTMIRIKTISEDELKTTPMPELNISRFEHKEMIDRIRRIVDFSQEGKLELVSRFSEYGHLPFNEDDYISTVMDDMVDYLDMLENERQVLSEITAVFSYAYKHPSSYIKEFIDEYATNQTMANRLHRDFELLENNLFL